MSVGSNIKKYRNLKKMTQKQLSEKTEISISAINKYENGKRQPRTEMLVKIAEALDIDLLTLVADDNYMIEEDDLKKLKTEVKDQRLLYHQPSIVKDWNRKAPFWEGISTILTSDYLQEEFNYNYMDLITEEDYNEIIDFIYNMLKMKIGEIKSRKK